MKIGGFAGAIACAALLLAGCSQGAVLEEQSEPPVAPVHQVGERIEFTDHTSSPVGAIVVHEFVALDDACAVPVTDGKDPRRSFGARIEISSLGGKLAAPSYEMFSVIDSEGYTRPVEPGPIECGQFGKVQVPPAGGKSEGWVLVSATIREPTQLVVTPGVEPVPGKQQEIELDPVDALVDLTLPIPVAPGPVDPPQQTAPEPIERTAASQIPVETSTAAPAPAIAAPVITDCGTSLMYERGTTFYSDGTTDWSQYCANRWDEQNKRPAPQANPNEGMVIGTCNNEGAHWTSVHGLVTCRNGQSVVVSG